jgi:hypothetical protein
MYSGAFFNAIRVENGFLRLRKFYHDVYGEKSDEKESKLNV